MISSFAYPLALFVIPVATLGLVLIYKNKGNAVKRYISSALFLEMIEKKKAVKTKFKPPLRFFMELILFSLLALGAAKYISDSLYQEIEIVVDNSLSMATLDLSSQPAENRLQKAVTLSQEYLDNLTGYGTKIKIWSTTPSLHLITKNAVSPRRAKKVLESIAIQQGSDKLANAIRRIKKETQSNEIILFTDKSFSNETESLVKVKTVERNFNKQNIAIKNISLIDEDQKNKNILVSISGFIKEEAEVTVTLAKVDFSNRQQPESKVRQANVKILPGKNNQVTFGNIDPQESYVAEILTNDRAIDLNPLDNKGWLTTGTERKNRISLYSRVSAQRLGLTQIKNFQIVSNPKNNDINSSFSIFYGQSPLSAIAQNSLIIMPPESKIESTEKLSYFNSAHPINSYVSQTALKLNKIMPLKMPDWAEKIIETPEGVILYAGQNQNFKQAVYGFDPLPYLGKENPLQSILLLNTFKWLAEKNIGKSYIEPGDTVTSSTPLFYEDGSDLEVTKVNNYKAYKTGILHTEPKESKKLFVAVNFFSNEESNPQKKIITLSNQIPEATLNNTAGESYTTLLALLALFLLLLDFLLFDFKRRKFSSQSRQSL